MGAEARGATGDAGPEHGDEGVPQQVPHVALWSNQAQGDGDVRAEHAVDYSD